MWTATKTCGWCHTAVVVLTDDSPQTCPACGHDPVRPRGECGCAQCRRPAPLTAEDLDELRDRTARRDP